MASILNADDGVVSGSAGLKSTADSSGVLALQTNGTTAVTVTAAGSVGIGVTPSAWNTSSTFFKALQIGTNGSLFGLSGSAGATYASANIGSNLFYDGTYFKAIISDYAARYMQFQGGHFWFSSASSVSAGNNITFTQAMTLLANGNLGVGTTNPLYSLQIGDTGANLAIGGAPTTNGTGRLKFINSTTHKSWQISTNDSAGGAFEFARSTAAGGSTFSAPDMVINSIGNVGIGLSNPSAKLEVNPAADSYFTGGLRVNRSNDGTQYGTVTCDGNLVLTSVETAIGAPVIAFRTSTNGTTSTERARFNSTGALVFAGGTTTANGIGITFPATQSASSDANTLDDYEEGTFSPTIFSGITGVTYSIQNGSYTKVGRLVTFALRLELSAGTAAADILRIGSLPFTSDGTFRGYAGSWAFAGSSILNSTSTNLPTLNIDAGATTIAFYNTAGSAFNGTSLATASGFSVDLFGSYYS